MLRQDNVLLRDATTSRCTHALSRPREVIRSTLLSAQQGFLGGHTAFLRGERGFLSLRSQLLRRRENIYAQSIEELRALLTKIFDLLHCISLSNLPYYYHSLWFVVRIIPSCERSTS